MQKITPFLWFDNQAEEAANYYCSIFTDSKILEVSRFGDAGPGPKGWVMVVKFVLNGVEFLALNGGPNHPFTDAVSLMIYCETQAEVDHYWSRLTDGGQEVACGWLKDKYGLSWQVTPTILLEYLRDKDPAKAKRVMETMMKMVKLDIAPLKKAYEG
ncbi:MAG TPA: VOC family protein [Gammaproteobacteria bacterium]|nr:VOC family protein [Gammaproteobacteria bacterium]